MSILLDIIILILLIILAWALFIGVIWLSIFSLNELTKFILGLDISYIIRDFLKKRKDKSLEKLKRGFFGLGNLEKSNFCPFCNSSQDKNFSTRWTCGTKYYEDYKSSDFNSKTDCWILEESHFPGAKLPDGIIFVRSRACKLIKDLKTLLRKKVEEYDRTRS